MNAFLPTDEAVSLHVIILWILLTELRSAIADRFMPETFDFAAT